MTKRFAVTTCAILVCAGLAVVAVGVALRQNPQLVVLASFVIVIAVLSTGLAVGATTRRYRAQGGHPPQR